MDQQALLQLITAQAGTKRRNDRVVCIGRSDGQFTGNVKYLFLHLAEHAPELAPTLLTFSRETLAELEGAGLPALYFPSPKGARAAAEAGTVFVDDFHYKMHPVSLLLGGARVVQLWHGVGFKKIGFLEAESGLDLSPERREELRRLYSGYHAVVSTSPFYTEHLFRTSFGAEQIWETGYPRNDVFFRRPTRGDMVRAAPEVYGEVKRLSKTRKVVLYVPTFREQGANPLSDGALDLPRLDAFLGAIGMVLVIKMHTFTGRLPRLPFANILAFPSDEDVYPLMPLTHAMITDYSSIYTDYLTMNKPVLFYAYDREAYQARHRELQFDYDWITPGPKLATQDELLTALRLLARDGDDGYAGQRAEVGRLAFAKHDGGASARVLARLRQELSS
jgi:CDP-glycerol glycerophosphotransferase